MRTTFKILIALAVIGTGFGAYWWFQPAMHIDVARATPTGPAAQRPTGEQPLAGMGPGDSVWVKQYDDQGRILYQFKADEYVPQGGGNVAVKRPRTIFYLKAGKKRQSNEAPGTEHRSRLEIDGTDGNIVVENTPDAPKDGLIKKESFGHGAMQPPRKGKLHTVKIRLYDDENADANEVKPSLAMETDNIAFDNETFRIFTEGYTDKTTGEQIAADRVKVDVRGTYDIVGYGLTIRWNDLDQRLELLKIHHGESLTINDMSLLRGTSLGGKPATAAAAGEGDEPTEAVSLAGPPAPVAPPVSFSMRRSDVILVEDAPPKAKKGKKDKAAPKLPDAATPATKSATSKPVKPPQPPYHAVFTQDVVVKQGEQTLAVADVMNIDFLMDSGKRSTAGSSSTQPSTGPATKPSSENTTKPATAPAAGAATVATTAPATAPTAPAVAATQPAQEKITVFWLGPLIITPATAPAELALKPGETVLQFVGKPAVLTRDGSEVKCAVATYRSLEGHMDLHNSDEFPKVLIRQLAKDAKPDALPATIRTDWAEYSMLTKLAILHGRSEANIPIPPQSSGDAVTQPTEVAAAVSGPAEMMQARWTKQATFHLSGDSESQMSIENAEFVGDVDVSHPQMKLKSQALQLAFDPTGAIKTTDGAAPGSPANLKQAIATQDVWCELADAKGKKQTIVCDRLDLKTALADDGRMYPQIVDATGKVIAKDDTQELKAGHVVMTLAPTAKPQAAAGALTADAVADADNRAVVPSTPAPLLPGSSGIELRSMVATEAVSVRSPDGATAVGDSLSVSAEPGVAGRTTVVLLGAPARVVDASENVITGPKIIVRPHESIATIEGAGTMDATQSTAAGPGKSTTRPAGEAKTSRPLHVTWTDSAIVNGPRNRIEAIGKVTASTPDPDGTINTAQGDRVVVVMVDKLVPESATQPAGTAPATKPVVTQAKTTTQPADGAGGGFKMDLFKDKEVGSVVLLDKDKAFINSNLTALDGTVLRETQLQATSMRFQPRDGQMLIPVPGEMIVRDHRPEEKSATTTKPANTSNDSAGRGDTAFKWNKSLAYDQTKRRAVMAGDVLIVHKPEAQKDKPAAEPAKGGVQQNPADPVRVNADWVAADFEPPAAAPKSAPSPADKQAEPGAMRLKALTAIGNITITRTTGQMTAQKIVFNPQTGWITATGTPNNPASYTDLATGQATSALEIWWNTQTWDVRFKNITARASR